MKSIRIRPISGALHPFKLGYAVIAFGMANMQASEGLPEHALDLGTRDIVGSFVADALRDNPGLEAADKRYHAAKEGIVSAGVLPNPKFQLTHFVESIQTRTGPQEQALMLQQPVPWLGKLSSKREMARNKSEALWHAYSVQQFKLVDQVAKQVLAVAFLDKAIVITRENVELLEGLEKVVEDKVKAGGELSDLLRLQVETERFRDMLAKQETQRVAALSQLASLMGRDVVDLPSLIWEAPATLQSDSSAWIDSVTKRSPQIAMLRSLEDSQEARERLARFASKPDFTVGLNYIRTDDALNPNSAGSGDDPWALMVGVSLPVWGKANNAIALQATLEKESVRAQIEDLELRLRGDARAWVAKLDDAQERIQRYEDTLLPLARQAQEIVETGYRSGKESILDLIESDRALLKLETEYWRSAADAWVARWKLATLAGGLWLD